MKASHLLLAAGLLLGCSSEETGTVTFTTWGEDYIESGIPAGDEGFVDGWSVEYDKFLVAFANLAIADAAGNVAVSSDEQFVVDNVQPGRKQLVSFGDLEAKAWPEVSYEIRPPTSAATLIRATSDDLELLVEGGYSLYVEGTANKGEVSKTFALGFSIATGYHDCRAETGGKQTAGIVVTSGSENVSELTTHGDHLFYDRLQGSAGTNLETSLRFEAIARADDEGDGDGAITAEELAAQGLDVTLYDPSGLPADDLLEFMTGLARSVGHFRGEGECSLAKLE